MRRGASPDIRIPIYRDWSTSYKGTDDEPYPGYDFGSTCRYIQMNGLTFGAGNYAQYITFLAQNMDHARHLHDQLIPIAPLMSAFTAGSSIYKGSISQIYINKAKLLSGTQSGIVYVRLSMIDYQMREMLVHWGTFLGPGIALHQHTYLMVPCTEKSTMTSR